MLLVSIFMVGLCSRAPADRFLLTSDHEGPGWFGVTQLFAHRNHLYHWVITHQCSWNGLQDAPCLYSLLGYWDILEDRGLLHWTPLCIELLYVRLQLLYNIHMAASSSTSAGPIEGDALGNGVSSFGQLLTYYCLTQCIPLSADSVWPGIQVSSGA